MGQEVGGAHLVDELGVQFPPTMGFQTFGFDQEGRALRLGGDGERRHDTQGQHGPGKGG